MKSEHIDLIGTLRTRIKKIIDLYEKERDEKKDILEQNKELLSRIEAKEKEINELEQKYNTLKISKSILAGSESDNEARLKVNRIVREIDKCIALLNR